MGDKAVALKNGPVLSQVYELIKGVTPKSQAWSDYIHRVHYSVEIRADLGPGKLSKGTIQ